MEWFVYDNGLRHERVNITYFGGRVGQETVQGSSKN